MRRNQGGWDGPSVNTASTTPFLGLANHAVYTTTTAAVVGLTPSVATWCDTSEQRPVTDWPKPV